MSQTYNLGKVAITPRGAYSSTAQYTPLDIFSYNGSSYLVLQNCMGVTPPNATYYMVVASKGDTGSAGASPTIAAGAVTMTPAGTSASVTNVGTNVNASFNFTLPNGNVIYTGTGVTGTSTTPTVFSGSGVSNAGVGDIYFNTSTVAFYRCALGGNASTAKWAFLTYAVPDGSVTTDKIADCAVTTNKINDGAVGVDEIADGSVSSSKLGSDVTATLENKANVDGAYEQMTVGNAEQLVSTVGINDNAPYNFRTSGGSADIGDRETDAIVGGTIAWNQLCPATEATQTLNDVKITNNGDGTFTLNGTCSSSARFQFGTPTIHLEHKYLIMGISGGSSTKGYFCVTNNGAIKSPHVYNDGIFAFSGNGNQFSFRIISGAVYDNYVVRPQLFDITAMFGSAIADYAYTLESGTAGSGIAWLQKYGFFTKPYYANNAGQLMSVNTSVHKMVGFNQFSTSSIKYGSSSMYNKSAGDLLSVSDTSSAVTINSTNPADITITNTTNCRGSFFYLPKVVKGMQYMISYRISGTTTADIKRSLYTCDSNFKVIRRITNASYVAENYTYIYTHAITVQDTESCIGIDVESSSNQTIHLYDLCIHLKWDGERDGEYESYTEHTYPLDSDLTLRGIPKLDASNNLYYDGDVYESDGTVTRNYASRAYTSGDSTDGSTMITDGTTTVYKLTTPTTESADPYTNPQIVDDWGTEEYVDYGYYTGTRDVSIPVGHDTLYAANLRAKLEMSPNSPDGDGLYAVRQSGGINTYEEIIFPTELPSAPTSDGTYRLVCTVADGVATYSWTAN